MTSLVHTTTGNRKLWSRYHDEAPGGLKYVCRNGLRRLYLEVKACCKRMPCFGVLLFLLSLLRARKKLRNRFLTVSRTECQDRLRPSVDLPRRLSGVYCSN